MSTAVVVAPRPLDRSLVCFKMRDGSREISIACDDSCGTMRDLNRSDMRLYEDGMDVTDQIFDPKESWGTVIPGIAELRRALDWLETGK